MTQYYWIINTFAGLEVLHQSNSDPSNHGSNYICFPSTLRECTIRDLCVQRSSAKILNPPSLFAKLALLLILNQRFRLYIPHLHPSLFQHKIYRMLWAVLLYTTYKRSNRIFFYDEGLSTLHALSGTSYYPPARHNGTSYLLNRYQHAFYLPLFPSIVNIPKTPCRSNINLLHLVMNSDFTSCFTGPQATVHVLASRFLDQKKAIALIQYLTTASYQCVYYPHPNRDKNIDINNLPVSLCQPSQPIELYLEHAVRPNDIVIAGFTSVISYLVDLSICRNLTLGFLIPLLVTANQPSENILLSLYKECLDSVGIKTNLLIHSQSDKLGHFNHNIQFSNP